MARVLTALFGLLIFAGCSVDILHEIPESQANEVVAVLQREGVPAEKQRVTEGSGASYTVTVRRGDAPRAWRILRQKHLPRPKEDGLGEVFGDLGLVPSPTQERALLRHALAGEVARTLNSVDGVRQARVHIVLPERDALALQEEKRSEPRAAVLLKTDGALDLSVEDVRQLVAGSVEGLSAQHVSVVISRRDATAAESAGEGALVSLGPFRVSADSRSSLTTLLVGAVVAILALALAVLGLVRQNRILARRAARPTPPPGPAGDASASLALLERSFSRRP